MDDQSPTYRGVEKDKILNSVRQGLQFLKDLHIGHPRGEGRSATDAMLTDWDSDARLAEIEAALTDTDLVRAMRSTGARVFFNRFYEILKLRALIDPREGEKSRALTVYAQLMEWAAFVPAKTSAIPDVDAEIADFLLFTYLNNCNDAPENELRRIKETLAELDGDTKTAIDLVEWMEMIIPVLKFLMRTRYEDQIRDLLLKATPQQAALVPLVLRNMTGLQQREEAMDIQAAISPYRIILGPMPDGDVEAALRPVLAELDRLIPFAALDEICEFMHAGPTAGGDALGLTFYSSQRAAQACANVMPDRQIVNSKGQQIQAKLPPPEASVLPIFS